MDLTEKQWNTIKKFIPADPKRKDRRGRPWSDQRRVFNGTLWILRTPKAFGVALRSVSDYASAFSGLAKSRGDRSGAARAGSGFGPGGGLDLSECFLFPPA